MKHCEYTNKDEVNHLNIQCSSNYQASSQKLKQINAKSITLKKKNTLNIFFNGTTTF